MASKTFDWTENVQIDDTLDDIFKRARELEREMEQKTRKNRGFSAVCPARISCFWAYLDKILFLNN